MNVQQLQPTFTQSQFNKTQSRDKQTDTQCNDKNTNQSAESSAQSSVVTMNQSSKVTVPVAIKGWTQSNQAPPEEEEPVMDICTDDAFIGGSCLRLETDVVHSKFPKYG